MPTVCFHTLGCKLNQAETASLQEQFKERGYLTVPWGEQADVAVLNTCTVTSRSDSKCRQAVKHILGLFPETTMVVVGCYSQVEPGEVEGLGGVDYVFGTYDKFALFDHFPGPGKRAVPLVAVSLAANSAQTGLKTEGGAAGEHTRAFLKIQSGCSRACAYCIVPRARGPSFSIPIETIVKQAQSFTGGGFREIVLTGTHIGDYGKEKNGLPRLAALVRTVALIEGCGRIRLSSLDPEDMDDGLLECVSSLPNICRHIHLSLQSGSASVIRSMNRRTPPELVRSRMEKWTSTLGPIGLGADVITGFPGESTALFEESYAFIESLPFTYLHVFPFSPRKGTAAYAMPGQVHSTEKTMRTERLRGLGLRKKKTFAESWVEKRAEILPESRNRGGMMGGWSSEYVRVQIPYDPMLVNKIVNVQISSVDAMGALGTAAINGDIK